MTHMLHWQPDNCTVIIQHCSSKQEWHSLVLCECGRVSGQRQSLQQSLFQVLESLLAVWFEQARARNAVIYSLLRKEPLHTATKFHVKDFIPSIGWIYSFKQQVLLCTKSIRKAQKGRHFNSGEMEKGTVTGNNNTPKNIYNADETGLCIGFHLTRQWVFKAFQAMVEEFHGQDNNSVSLQCQ